MPDKISEKFDVLSVKLKGKNLIEAAAGTGKTYSIAIMVLRWIVSTDLPIDSVLAVTFTNYATAELKERILNFLEEALAFFETGKCKDDTIEKVCREIPENEQKKAVKKLKAAINDFDTASIFTIHGFCQKLIREHAFELGIDFKMELSEDADLSNEAAIVFFRENIMNCEQLDENGRNLLENRIFRGMLSRKSLKEFISKAGIGIENKNIKISTDELKVPLADKIAGIYKNFAENAPLIVKENRERKNVMGFDDILLIIYEVLKDTESSSAKSLREIMKERYSLVLIDEFQDTDPLQYFIFKTLFCNGNHTVFFIGDPKQSIYAFRKADIFSYIEAKKEVDNIYIMNRNFRSSRNAVEATNKVFNSADIFGDDSLIKYEPVSAAKSEKEYSLTINGKALPGLMVRETEAVRNKTELQKKLSLHVSQAIREMIKKDSPFKIREKTENGISEREVKASDIAVLTAKNDFALELCENLKKAGIPAIVEADTAKQLSIFSSDEALSLQKLLSAAATEGLAEFKTLLLTFFYNKTVDDIACSNDTVSELCEKFVSCFKDWNQKGFFAAFSKFTEDKSILGNIAEKGEKTVTVLRQLAELIHKHELSEGFSPLYTLKWFSEKIEDAAQNDKNIPEEESIRAESGKTDCVRIMTLHKSKGLEFNIVFFPFILNSATGCKWVLQHRKTSSGYERSMIFMPAKEAEKDQPGQMPNDDKLEEIRRIYVGITRAKYLTVCYTQQKEEYLEKTSLFVNNEDSEFINKEQLKTEECGTSKLITKKNTAEKPELLAPEEATREIKPEWALTSFSGIISHGQNEESLENEDENLDTPENMENRIGSENETETAPMALFPSGTEAGTVLHSIFEEADFSCTDNSEIIRTILKKKMNFSSDELEKAVSTVNECLNSVCSAPLFEGGGTLRDVQNSKTAEMEFFLSIKSELHEGKLSKIIEDNYRTIKLEADSVKKGFLHGFIDLVAKFDGKYYVIDWKSNNLGDYTCDYDRKNIEAEMKKHNYYLQYMLYLAAFDSYMQKVDANYSYEKNFGGIKYVFLRGVKPGSIETGVFSDRPEESELRKIQKLFEGEK